MKAVAGGGGGQEWESGDHEAVPAADPQSG